VETEFQNFYLKQIFQKYFLISLQRKLTENVKNMKGSKLAKPQNVKNVEEENQNLKKNI
jgi:hypothetical protein